MNVHINQACADGQSFGVQHLRPVIGQIGGNHDDAAIFNQNISDLLPVQHRVNQFAFMDQKLHKCKSTPHS